MQVEQISIFIENKSGRLAEVTRPAEQPHDIGVGAGARHLLDIRARHAEFLGRANEG